MVCRCRWGQSRKEAGNEITQKKTESETAGQWERDLLLLLHWPDSFVYKTDGSVLVSVTADWEPGNLKKPAASSKLDREGLSSAKYTSPQLYSKQLPGYTACQAVHAELPRPRSHDSTWHQGKAMIYLETSALTALFLLLSKSKAEASPSVDIFFLNPARLPIRLPYCSVE